MAALQELRYKIRYNPLPRLLLNGLKRLGITLTPYYLLRRSLVATRKPAAPPGAALVELGQADMAGLAGMAMANSTADEFERRLGEGHRCFGLRLEGELVGYCWMDPQRCSYPGEGFTLADDAAYAYDIYTAPAQRGRNCAPLLNGLFSERLAAEGIRTIYSTIDYYNRPSLRFAAKIGAQRLRLNVYVSLFGLLRRSFCLRQKLSRA
jgi:GNAT superfamily N-acetyltransferase